MILGDRRSSAPRPDSLDVGRTCGIGDSYLSHERDLHRETNGIRGTASCFPTVIIRRSSLGDRPASSIRELAPRQQAAVKKRSRRRGNIRLIWVFVKPCKGRVIQDPSGLKYTILTVSGGEVA